MEGSTINKLCNNVHTYIYVNPPNYNYYTIIMHSFQNDYIFLSLTWSAEHKAILSDRTRSSEFAWNFTFNEFILGACIIVIVNIVAAKLPTIAASDGQNRVILRINSFVFEYFENRDQYSNTEY